MNGLLEQLSALTGMSLTSTTLLVGVVIGFMLRSLFKGRVLPTSSQRMVTPRPHGPTKRFLDVGVTGSEAVISQLSLNANGQSVVLNSEQTKELGEFIARGDKINAIKRLREISKLGLAEAKSLVDLLETKLRGEK